MNRLLIQGDLLRHNVHDGHLLCTTSQNAAREVRVAAVKVEARVKMGEVGAYDVLKQTAIRVTGFDVQLLEQVGWQYAGQALPSKVTDAAYRQAKNEIDKERREVAS